MIIIMHNEVHDIATPTTDSIEIINLWRMKIFKLISFRNELKVENYGDTTQSICF